MKRGLQIGLALFSLIPLYFGITGLVFGLSLAEIEGPGLLAVDNQFRYLCAIYLLVSFILWSIISDIERQGRTLALVLSVIFLGALARAWAAIEMGGFPDMQRNAMIVELCLPLFLIWQRLVARKAAAA